jgi:outer membrane autotransporter protein
MDYHATPETIYGFALAGGGTNWDLAQGLGTGRSDAFQAGLYAKNYLGPAYLAGALAFTNNWMTTDRTALGDEITAHFSGQSYGGRLETGYRYSAQSGAAVNSITPYAALQTQWFHTPTYSETDLAGGGLGLTYNAMTANDTRSELGARFDDLTLLDSTPLMLTARLAWAHDWVKSPTLDAVFQSLPGTSFVVNGATPPPNSALASAGAELRMSPDWSLLVKFDGEFAPGSQTYAGTGTLRYRW